MSKYITSPTDRQSPSAGRCALDRNRFRLQFEVNGQLDLSKPAVSRRSLPNDLIRRHTLTAWTTFIPENPANENLHLQVRG